MEQELYTHIFDALNVKGEVVHISEVESGKKGYICRSCGREMQAKKGDILIHHFSHDATDVKRNGKCTYSNETYRHKVAKDILQRIKQIKVPVLYKFPELGQEGKPNKLRPAETIHADSVGIELCFFEDEVGNIRWTSHDQWKEADGRHLLIQPDVTFFNKDKKPILLIEVVATHKIDAQKLAKIKRLGLNTVQVSIPKEAPEAIEKTFLHNNRTEWIFNYEQESTEYVRVSFSNAEGIPSISEFQKGLLEESVKCRTAQIGNLIRGIRKALESESHRESEQGFIDEIERVERNTERNREQLSEVKERVSRETRTEFESQLVQLRAAQDEFESKFEGLESRYKKRRSELKEEAGRYRSVHSESLEKVDGEIDEIERKLKRFGGKWESFREGKEEVEREIGRVESAIDNLRRKISEIENEESSYEIRSGKSQEDVRTEFERRRKEIEASLGREKDELDRKFEEATRASIETFEKRNGHGNSTLSRSIKELLDARRDILNIQAKQDLLRRIRKAIEFIESGAYKNWT